MAVVNGGYFHYTNMNKFLKKVFSETTGQIFNDFIEMFLEWPFSKIVHKILICQ